MNETLTSISPTELFERRISIFKTVRASNPLPEITVFELLGNVQNGRWRDEITSIRNAKDKATADKLKVSLLPAVKVSGVFTGLAATDLVEHSGVLCIDIDNVGASMTYLRSLLSADPHVVSVFVSPRADGLKVFVPIAARTSNEHSACVVAARRHFAAILPDGVKLDAAPSNVSSNCFVSYDPDLWRATQPRSIFRPLAGSNKVGGCDIDIAHVIESNEKEPSLSPPPVYGNTGEIAPTPESREVPNQFTPPPPGWRLPGIVDTVVWANWVKRVPYAAGIRNAVISERVPILLNLVDAKWVSLLLLRWFDEAPQGRFNDTRGRHWMETQSAIAGCLKSWDTNAKVGLSKIEAEAYCALSDDRQRTTFRICRSLSLAKSNIERRIFFTPCGQLGERLDCHSEAASRQLEYLVRAQIIMLIESGAAWTPKTKSQASRYKWLMK